MIQKRKNHKQATMYDVARLAGVSQPTVSRVLSQAETSIPVSDETRARVLAAVQELGYRPNAIAQSLRTQRTQMIALLIADISNGFYHVMARAVQDVARQRHYEVLISNSDHIYENEIHFCEVVSRRALDGVIMVPIHLTLDDIHRFFVETGIPIATLAEHFNDPNIDSVFVNDEAATYDAIRWMITERGYENIGYIGVPDDLPPGPRRRRGFQRAMRDSGLSIDPRFMLESDFTLEGGKAVARELLQIGELPRALYVLNDLMAIGVILELQEAGYRIPDDIAVLGFDDIPEAQIVRPMLTTIAQDPRDIGTLLAESLFSRMESPVQVERRVIESKSRLVVRDSA
jgi:LacI family transcriptional regulator